MKTNDKSEKQTPKNNNNNVEVDQRVLPLEDLNRFINRDHKSNEETLRKQKPKISDKDLNSCRQQSTEDAKLVLDLHSATVNKSKYI